MTAASVRIIKFDAGSPTDMTLARMQEKLHASSGVEAMRRSLYLADKLTDFAQKGRKVFVENEDGSLSELLIS